MPTGCRLAEIPGEDARLYTAVKAVSDFAIKLGINIPTGKDSLSMTQKYPDGGVVYSPGTVIISAAGEVSDVSRKAVSPLLSAKTGTVLVYINMSADKHSLGGSSFAQVVNRLGDSAPDIKKPQAFAAAFTTIQIYIEAGKILAGHDISAGGAHHYIAGNDLPAYQPRPGPEYGRDRREEHH